MKTKESVFLDMVKDLTPSIQVGVRTDVTFKVKNVRKTEDKDLYEFDCVILKAVKENVPCPCKKNAKVTISEINFQEYSGGQTRRLYQQFRTAFIHNEGKCNADFIKIRDSMKLFGMSEESYVANIFREKNNEKNY